MNVQKLFWGVVIFAVLTFLLTGCSEEDNPVKAPSTPDPPTFSLRSIPLPDNLENSPNEMAQQAVSIIEEAMRFDNENCCFEKPEVCKALTEKTGEWEYQWSDGNLTKNLKVTTKGDRDAWQFYLNGNSNGKTFDNFRAMDAVQQKNKSNGHVHLFKSNSIQIETQWVWYTLDNGNYLFTKESFAESRYNLEITIHTDKSGKIERYVLSPAGSMVYDVRFTWEANGSGAWWTYEAGQQKDYGTW